MKWKRTYVTPATSGEPPCMAQKRINYKARVLAAIAADKAGILGGHSSLVRLPPRTLEAEQSSTEEGEEDVDVDVDAHLPPRPRPTRLPPLLRSVRSQIRLLPPPVSLSLSLSLSCFCGDSAGTMTMGEQSGLPESLRLLDAAFDGGVNFFDSAEMYPVPQRRETHGRSEEFLGRWLRARRVSRGSVVLATKVAGPSGQMNWIRDGPVSLDWQNITEAIDSSLRRLGVDYIDLYQIHWPDRYVPMFGETEYDPSHHYVSVPMEEQLMALGRAIDAGKIRYIGLSNETPYGLMKFLQLSRNSQLHQKILTVQNSYNLLCRNFDAGLAECCHHERISLLAYSPMAMGILSGKYYLSDDGGPADARMNLFKGLVYLFIVHTTCIY
ncbi:hypothetical protein GUJ93_ZPchr0011g28735 [Zizania palustris]|uniref:NADP-dependent oxidoreductase domain-containing protein n=1 Tax=Zizania palustris TaxID=103762 RepID=A0A8J5WIQ9_ZIZPA|nr:hypothetical protein GUJ93_ZPchr0011g28735 [Zizania palustris]